MVQLTAPAAALHLFLMNKSDKKQAWVEVSLQVNGELAEPVADVLADRVPGGVVMEEIDPAPGEGEGQPRIRVYGYLPVDDSLQDRKTDIERALWHLGQIETLPQPSFQPLEGQDWRTAWQKNYRPISLGKRLIVVPSWMESPDEEREAIFISPGMAFGSGTHPSTQLALAMVDRVLLERDAAPEVMIDIGCGSGILSIAAVKLGVPAVWALDHDPQAVRVAEENVLENGVQGQVRVREGSVADIVGGSLGIQQAPLVCANIIAPVLKTLFQERLRDLVQPQGILILSGILDEQAPDMVDLLREHGFCPIARLQQDDWVALRSQKV